MARRCPYCLAPTKRELVFHRRIGPDHRPQLYHYVRRYTCPEGCTSVLDFSKAKKLVPGVTPMVLPKTEKLEKAPDFNDRLLTVGLGVSFVLFVLGVLFISTSVPIKLAAIGGFSAFMLAIGVLANQRVVLPESFPRPIRPPAIVETEEEETDAAVAAPVISTGPKPKAAPAEIVFPDVIPPLERAEGEAIKMSVILGDAQYEIELNDGENMLDGALERDVEIDFSCRQGNCDSCVVRVLAGLNNITDPTPEEFDMIGEEDIAKGFRLACMTKVNGPVNIYQEG